MSAKDIAPPAFVTKLHGPLNVGFHSGAHVWYIVDWYGAKVCDCGGPELAAAVAYALNRSPAVHLHL